MFQERSACRVVGRAVHGVRNVEARQKLARVRNVAVDRDGGLARLAGRVHPATSCADDAARIAKGRLGDAPDDVARLDPSAGLELNLAEVTLAHLEVVDDE